MVVGVSTVFGCQAKGLCVSSLLFRIMRICLDIVAPHSRSIAEGEELHPAVRNALDPGYPPLMLSLSCGFVLVNAQPVVSGDSNAPPKGVRLRIGVALSQDGLNW